MSVRMSAEMGPQKLRAPKIRKSLVALHYLVPPKKVYEN